MKASIPFATLLAGAASMAIAPALSPNVHAPALDHGPTVDGTSTRGEWVSSYSNKGEVGNGPTVDGTSTRGEWVSSYSNKDGGIGTGPTIDGTSTRGQWVTSYSNNGNHWLPTGPGYLDVNSLEEGYHAHLMIMHDSSSWIQSGMINFKRFFHSGSI